MLVGVGVFDAVLDGVFVGVPVFVGVGVFVAVGVFDVEGFGRWGNTWRLFW